MRHTFYTSCIIIAFIAFLTASCGPDQDELNQEIFRTVKASDYESMVRLLQQGAAINTTYENGNTLMHYAIDANYDSIYLKLLSLDPDLLFAKNSAGLDPVELHMDSCKNFTTSLKVLLLKERISNPLATHWEFFEREDTTYRIYSFKHPCKKELEFYKASGTGSIKISGKIQLINDHKKIKQKCWGQFSQQGGPELAICEINPEGLEHWRVISQLSSTTEDAIIFETLLNGDKGEKIFLPKPYPSIGSPVYEIFLVKDKGLEYYQFDPVEETYRTEKLPEFTPEYHAEPFLVVRNIDLLQEIVNPPYQSERIVFEGHDVITKTLEIEFDHDHSVTDYMEIRGMDASVLEVSDTLDIGIWIKNSTGAVLNGLKIVTQDPKGKAGTLIKVSDSRDVYLLNNKLESAVNRSAVNLENSFNVELEHNEIMDPSDDPTYLKVSNSKALTLKNNIFYGAKGKLIVADSNEVVFGKNYAQASDFAGHFVAHLVNLLAYDTIGPDQNVVDTIAVGNTVRLLEHEIGPRTGEPYGPPRTSDYNLSGAWSKVAIFSSLGMEEVFVESAFLCRFTRRLEQDLEKIDSYHFYNGEDGEGELSINRVKYNKGVSTYSRSGYEWSDHTTEIKFFSLHKAYLLYQNMIGPKFPSEAGSYERIVNTEDGNSYTAVISVQKTGDQVDQITLGQKEDYFHQLLIIKQLEHDVVHIISEFGM